MKSEEWKSYRTRFLVNAKQLNSSLSFVDHLGRQHCGQKGDYLVESSDGLFSITPRAIFEDIYVPMSHQPLSGSESALTVPPSNEASSDRLKFEALEIEELKLPKSATGRSRHTLLSNVGATAVRRKLPQPFRDRRGSSQHMRLM